MGAASKSFPDTFPSPHGLTQLSAYSQPVHLLLSCASDHAKGGPCDFRGYWAVGRVQASTQMQLDSSTAAVGTMSCPVRAALLSCHAEGPAEESVVECRQSLPFTTIPHISPAVGLAGQPSFRLSVGVLHSRVGKESGGDPKGTPPLPGNVALAGCPRGRGVLWGLPKEVGKWRRRWW